MNKVFGMIDVKQLRIFSFVIILLVNFFAIVININSVTSIDKDRIKLENEIKLEQVKLANNKRQIEEQIIEEVKRKEITSKEEKIIPGEIKSINNLALKK